jgi:hypothetical protein
MGVILSTAITVGANIFLGISTESAEQVLFRSKLVFSIITDKIKKRGN